MSDVLAITSNEQYLIGHNAYATIGGVHKKVKQMFLTIKKYEGRGLPAGYIEYEYLQSDGKVHIDSGFKPNNNTRVICDFQVLDTSKTTAVFGSWAFDSDYNVINPFLLMVNPTYFTPWYGSDGATDFSTSIGPSLRYTCDFNKNKCTIGGASVTLGASTFTSEYNLWFFSDNFMGSRYQAATCKIWSAKVYDNGTLIKDLVPCKNPEGIFGMYDMVNLAFHPQKGSGTFTSGPEKPNGLVHQLCYSDSSTIRDLLISYTGNMTDYGIVTMGDNSSYRLLALTSSGILEVSESVSAEVWMCGGGTSGKVGNGSAGGGAGAFTTQGAVQLSGSMPAIVGAGGATAQPGYINGVQGAIGYGYNFGGSSSFGGLETSIDFKEVSQSGGLCGGTGGGNGIWGENISTGDGIDKHPFFDSTYFTQIPCAGGGAGGMRHYQGTTHDCGQGGQGGTNGGNGQNGVASSNGSTVGGTGGVSGGGTGGYGDYNYNVTATAGGDATYYGSGGGSGGYNFSEDKVTTGGAGYQGIIYIRIPLTQ